MNKKILMLIGTFFLCLLAAGCGKKENEGTGAEAEKTVASEKPEKKPEENKNLVEMVKIDPSEQKKQNIIGKQTETASKLMIVNRTGAEVSDIFIRENEEEDWGDDLIQQAFTLKEGQDAVYYFEKGSASVLYDIRISYTDIDKSECFFRKIPLNTITKITLCMDGTGDDGIPYARYITSEKKEHSTLEEVKRRLGLLDDEEEEEENNTEEPSHVDQNDDEDEIHPEESGDDVTPSEDPQTPVSPEVGISAAQGCIGKPLSALLEACGEPNGTTYENEPETGETGYHYYTGFTVSTTVDENGDEIVAGVW